MSFTFWLSEFVVHTESSCIPQTGECPALCCDVEPVDLQQLYSGTPFGRVRVGSIEVVLKHS